MGFIDRVVRATAGIVLIALVFIGPQTAWGWVGVIPLLIALFGSCPLYSVLGIKTCKIKP
jgi:hypothetical protein